MERGSRYGGREERDNGKKDGKGERRREMWGDKEERESEVVGCSNRKMRLVTASIYIQTAYSYPLSIKPISRHHHRTQAPPSPRRHPPPPL